MGDDDTMIQRHMSKAYEHTSLRPPGCLDRPRREGAQHGLEYRVAVGSTLSGKANARTKKYMLSNELEITAPGGACELARALNGLVTLLE
jgi:hypothetical protein